MRKEEILKVLYGAHTKENYQHLLKYEESIQNSNELYQYFDSFIELLKNNSSSIRLRGFRLICALAKWDYQNKIVTNIELLLKELDHAMPAYLRQYIKAMDELLTYKKELFSLIKEKLISLDLSKYKSSMAPLLKKDINNLLNKYE